jgi:hypothetical protein
VSPVGSGTRSIFRDIPLRSLPVGGDQRIWWRARLRRGRSALARSHRPGAERFPARTHGCGRRRAADDDAAALELAETLGGLALALEHAGAYVDAHTITLHKYLGLWREGNEAVIAWCDPTISHYERTTAATLQISVARLTPSGRALLERLAFFAPERILEPILDVPIPEVEDEDLKGALADLAHHSLAIRDREAPLFSVHRRAFVSFEKRTGQPHPYRERAARYYVNRLRAIGKGTAEIEAILYEIVETA